LAFKTGTTGFTASETPADKKQRVAAEGRKALAQFEVEAQAVRKNMARLRELRLAKEAEDRAAELANPEPAKPAKTRAKTATGKKRAAAPKQA